eukprot:6024192-Amphidinium_carterae.1
MSFVSCVAEQCEILRGLGIDLPSQGTDPPFSGNRSAVSYMSSKLTRDPIRNDPRLRIDKY